MDPFRSNALLSAKLAKTKRSRSSNSDSSVLGYAIRLPFGEPGVMKIVSDISNVLLTGLVTLAIEHTSAYMRGITDLTLGVSG